MSVPAPSLHPAPTPVPRRAGGDRSPAWTPAAPPAQQRRATRRRTSRGPTAFWILTALLVTLLIVALVSLSALLVRSSFRIEDLRGSISALREEQEALETEVVTLSAPSRIAAWARDEGMIVAESAQVLRVRAGAGA